jgi:hypothetical protein
VAAALVLAGCKPRAHLNVHYLPDFVPGSQNIFFPARIAVNPTGGSVGAGEYEAGAIYSADGSAQTPLVVADAARALNNGLINGLTDAGLVPVALDSNPSDGKPPEGSDFILSSELEQFEVNKRFGANQTIHGQYFTMNAVVRAKFELKNRDGAVIYVGDITGLENEPPNPVGAEVFLPLETEPVESLSVAMSRAVGNLMLDPKFRAALPMRAIATTPNVSPAPLH